MRWQIYFPDRESMCPDLSLMPLDELLVLQSRIESRLDGLRAEEPSAKRKNECEHKVWFSQCQDYVRELQEVRDAIAALKK